LAAGAAPEKQSQFGQGAGYQGQGSAARAPAPALRASCTNKPNSDRGHVRGKSCMGKELWLIIHAEDFGKTKPVPGYAGRVAAQGVGGEDAKQTQFAATPRGTRPEGRGTMTPNKPNLAHPPAEAGASRGRLCQTNPIARSGAGGANPGGRGTRGIVQTNPVPALMPIRRSAFPGDNCVKQTQLAGGERAKRTQFGRAWAGPGSEWREDAKRSQFDRWHAGTSRTQRAKQSQFPPGWRRARTPNPRSGRGQAP
jgi:hypothetical protein